MTLREIVQALWRRRTMIEIAAVVSAFLGLTVVLLQGTEYQAETSVLITQQAVAAAGNDGLLTQQKLALLAITYAEVVSAPKFIDDAVERARINRDDAQVSGEALQNASIVRIVVRSSSANRASAVAGALTKALDGALRTNETSLPPELHTSTLVLEDPKSSLATTAPLFTVFAALVTGLAIAVTSALIVEMK